MECKLEDMLTGRQGICLRALNVVNESVVFKFYILNIPISNCFQLANYYLKDILHVITSFFFLVILECHHKKQPNNRLCLKKNESIVKK